MTTADLLHLRLSNQLLTRPDTCDVASVVRWLGAVQSQDYLGAKWAVAQRTSNLTSKSIDEAFAAGSILRTHVMRPTWHFVAAEDLRWMLTLTAPRVNALSIYYYRKLGLDDGIFAKTNELIARALQNGAYKTRNELGAILKDAGHHIDDPLRLIFIVGKAELDGIICSGPLKGKQHTYALLDERAPKQKMLTHDESLAELAYRYFASHGPATIADFTWWSGLTKTDARKGLNAVTSQLLRETLNEKEYWFKDTGKTPAPSHSLYLLPNYDEYTVAYSDRSDFFDTQHLSLLDSRQNSLFMNVIIIDGAIMGTWKRTIKAKSVAIDLHHFKALHKQTKPLLDEALARYSQYMELPIVIEEKT